MKNVIWNPFSDLRSYIKKSPEHTAAGWIKIATGFFQTKSTGRNPVWTFSGKKTYRSYRNWKKIIKKERSFSVFANEINMVLSRETGQTLIKQQIRWGFSIGRLVTGQCVAKLYFFIAQTKCRDLLCCVQVKNVYFFKYYTNELATPSYVSTSAHYFTCTRFYVFIRN